MMHGQTPLNAKKIAFHPMYVFEGCWKQIIIKVLFLIYLYIFVIFYHFKLKFTDNREKIILRIFDSFL